MGSSRRSKNSPLLGSRSQMGSIWARYSLVIIPKNFSLFTVNLFVGLTGYVQLVRALRYRYSQEQAQKALTATSQVSH
uniref:Mitochondrial pyruvate carrier n=1 Tax=Arion vulgaris TaxID=1028688 RepID=A0A0B7BH87_9EUPU